MPLSNAGKTEIVTPALFFHHEFEALHQLHLSRRGGLVSGKRFGHLQGKASLKANIVTAVWFSLSWFG